MYALLCLDPATLKELRFTDVPRRFVDQLTDILFQEYRPTWICIIDQRPATPRT